MAAQTLPCGCVMDTVGDTFVYQPCSPTCQYWIYVQQQMKAQDKRVETIFDPEVTPERQAEYLKRERETR